MKQGKRRLQLDRTTIRPLNPQQLAQIAGGTGIASVPSQNDCNDQGRNSDVCEGSMTQNYSNDLKCG
jgi:hypothetical protein